MLMKIPHSSTTCKKARYNRINFILSLLYTLDRQKKYDRVYFMPQSLVIDVANMTKSQS